MADSSTQPIRPTQKQLGALCADLDKFFNERPDDVSKPYARRVEGFIDGLRGLDFPPTEGVVHYRRGHRIGALLREQHGVET